MPCKQRYLFFSILMLFTVYSYGQNTAPDSLYTNAANHALDEYHKEIGTKSEIYNGAEYELRQRATKGSAYFNDLNYCTPAVIRYNGTWYKNVPVLYDIYNDEMVAETPENRTKYILQYGKLSDVYLGNHYYIYINNKVNTLLRPGYYDQLYTGKSQVLVKRVKTFDNRVASQGVETIYQDQNEIYVRKENTYYLVAGKNSLLKIFKDKKKELNQYIKDNKIKFNDDEESATARLTYYYDQINN